MKNILKEDASFFARIAEHKTGFRIGDSKFKSKRDKNGQDVYISDDSTLKVESKIVENKGGYAISRSITNISDKTSKPINVLEPLCFLLNYPAGKWRHIFANGGTTEFHYPPDAYKVQERIHSERDFVIESHPQGRSSNLHLPFLISMAHEGDTPAGFFCFMEWSITWYMKWQKIDRERSSFSVGIKVNGLRLEPGEVLELPAVHFGIFYGDVDDGTNVLRNYLYDNVCAEYKGKKVIPSVSYDHWFGIDNKLNAELLKKEADRAKQLGVEVFVVDASWFEGDFPYGVGNWEHDKKKFPDGLEPFAEYVRELGMDFGLWLEPERAVEGTDMIKNHPEWFVPIKDKYEKQMYHINLAVPEVQDYLIETIDKLIKRLKIKWSRWDYNYVEPEALFENIDSTMKIQFEYVKGLYRVIDTLMKNNPDWFVEQSSSGGRRLDAGMMRRAHSFWFSDQTVDPFICRYMQARANRFLPGHLLNSSVAVQLNQGDDGFSDASIMSRMLGKLAFDGDIASWSDKFTKRMAKWVKEFKAVRHLFVQKFYQLLPTPTTAEDWDAVQFNDNTGKESVVFIFAGITSGERNIRLKGLGDRVRYRLTQKPGNKSMTKRGKELMDKGITVKLKNNGSALVRLT